MADFVEKEKNEVEVKANENEEGGDDNTPAPVRRSNSLFLISTHEHDFLLAFTFRKKNQLLLLLP